MQAAGPPGVGGVDLRPHSQSQTRQTKDSADDTNNSNLTRLFINTVAPDSDCLRKKTNEAWKKKESCLRFNCGDENRELGLQRALKR